MPLAPGERAPGFRLRAIDNAYWLLGEPDRRRSVLVVFFRRESKACRVLLPFVERLHRRGRAHEAEILGISLDGQRDTLEFAEDYTLTFPILLDPPAHATARSYGVDEVPALFLLDANLRVAQWRTGWSKGGFESIAASFLSAVGADPRGIWEAGDIIPDGVDPFPLALGNRVEGPAGDGA